jgi:hypothetical protein
MTTAYSLLTKWSGVSEFAVIPNKAKEGGEMATNIRLAVRDIRA